MKKCRPNYKMDNFDGCGQVLPIFRYGSCQKCFIKWTQQTEKGSEWLKKQTAYKYKKNEKQRQSQERKLNREMKLELMSTAQYWSKVFEPKIREVIRTIDKGNGCIVKNTTHGKLAAGHYYSVGSNKTLSINCHNIFLQSFQSNGWRGGEPIQYMEGLVRVFGEDYATFVSNLKKCPALNLTKLELIKVYPKLLGIALNLKKQKLMQLTPLERIELRNEVNNQLKLYPEEFSVYKV